MYYLVFHRKKKKKKEEALGFSNLWGFLSPNLFVCFTECNLWNWRVLGDWYSFPIDRSQFVSSQEWPDVITIWWLYKNSYGNVGKEGEERKWVLAECFSLLQLSISQYYKCMHAEIVQFAWKSWILNPTYLLNSLICLTDFVCSLPFQAFLGKCEAYKPN